MEIDPTLKAANLRTDASAGEMRNWRVGQVLNAVAASDDLRGRAQLRIGSRIYDAQVPFTVRAGDRLALEVIRSGTTPLLRPASPPRSPEPLLTTALRSALPKQGPLAPLLATLTQFANRGATAPPQILEAARNLFQRLPSAAQVSTAAGLRQAVRDAGTQLEVKLAQAVDSRAGAEAGLSQDVKAGLLRLREALSAASQQRAPGAAPNPVASARAPELRTAPLAARNVPAEIRLSEPAPGGAPAPAAAGASASSAGAKQVPPLLPPLISNLPQPQARAAPLPPTLDATKLLENLSHQVEASLARLQLHQLVSHPHDGEQRQVWLLELPVRRDQGVDVLHLRIEADDTPERGTSGRTGLGWTVQLAFDLEGLGPVQARISVLHAQVSTRFWAERDATAELFGRHLHDLRVQLEAAGLEVCALSCKTGAPHAAAPAGAPSSGVLDERV